MAMKSKKIDDHKGQKRYIALRRIATRQGDEVWNPGAEIWLDDTKAALYLAKTVVQPADETKPPEQNSAAVKVHEANEEVVNGDTHGTAA